MKDLKRMFFIACLLVPALGFAQSSGITALDWDANPLNIIANPASNTALVGGNVTYQNQNGLTLAEYKNFDTTWTRSFYSPTLALISIGMAHDGPNQVTLAGYAADTAAFSAMLVRLDSTTGQIQWTKTFEIGTFGRFNGTTPLANGGSLALGQWNQWPVEYALLVRLDPLGDTVWTHSYTYSGGLEIEKVFEFGTDLLAVGSFNSDGSDASRVFVMRLNANGIPIWANQYYAGRSEWIADAQIDATGNLFFAVTSEDTLLGEATTRLMSIDANGAFRFGTDVDYQDYDESFSLLYWPNAGIFLGGTHSDGSTGPAVLERFDFNGNLQWAKSYLPGGYAEPQALIRFDNDRLLVGIVDEDATYGVHLIDMDSSGTLQSPCVSTVESPVTTPYTLTPQPLPVNVTAGCIVNTLTLIPFSANSGREHACISVGTMPQIAQEPSVVPNPFTTMAEIRVAPEHFGKQLQLQVWDISGREIQAQYHNTATGVQLQRSGMPAGIYLYRVTSKEDGPVATGRLLVE